MIKIEIYILNSCSQQLNVVKTEGERVGKKYFGAVLEWDITREWL